MGIRGGILFKEEFHPPVLFTPPGKLHIIHPFGNGRITLFQKGTGFFQGFSDQLFIRIRGINLFRVEAVIMLHFDQLPGLVNHCKHGFGIIVILISYEVTVADPTAAAGMELLHFTFISGTLPGKIRMVTPLLSPVHQFFIYGRTSGCFVVRNDIVILRIELFYSCAVPVRNVQPEGDIQQPVTFRSSVQQNGCGTGNLFQPAEGIHGYGEVRIFHGNITG